MLRALLLAVTVAVASLNLVPSFGDEPAEEQSIRASEVLNMRLIGILGQPFGKLAIVRGTWHLGNKKEQVMEIRDDKPVMALRDMATFQVAQIDGKPATFPAEFKSSNVIPLVATGWKSGARGIAWDWVGGGIGPSARLQAPSSGVVTEGEEWELLGTEVAMIAIQDFSQLFKELGMQPPPAQTPRYDSSFIFIAFRKLRPDPQTSP